MIHFLGIYLSPGDFSIAGFWPLGIKIPEEAMEPSLREVVRVVTVNIALYLEKGSLVNCRCTFSSSVGMATQPSEERVHATMDNRGIGKNNDKNIFFFGGGSVGKKSLIFFRSVDK